MGAPGSGAGHVGGFAGIAEGGCAGRAAIPRLLWGGAPLCPRGLHPVRRVEAVCPSSTLPATLDVSES